MDIAVGSDTPMTQSERDESDEDDVLYTECVVLSTLVHRLVQSLLFGTIASTEGPTFSLYFIIERIIHNLLLHASYPTRRHMVLRMGTQRRAELNLVRDNLKFDTMPKRNRRQLLTRKRVLLDYERARAVSSPGMCLSSRFITDAPALSFTLAYSSDKNTVITYGISAENVIAYNTRASKRVKVMS